MRRILLISSLIFLTTFGYSQNIDIVKYEQLEQRWNNSSDTVYIINYWATWCKPCVEELPDFIKLNDEMKSRKFKMILVSLDFPSHVNSRVIPFIEKRNITPEVIILDDDANVWINKVNKDWDGAIPATLIIKGSKSKFHSEQLNYSELKDIINNL